MADGATAARDTDDPGRIEHNGPKHEPLRRSRFRALVEDFQPIWFSWCMNSGILGILMHQYSYQFPGLAVLADIAFVVDLTLFVSFSAIFLLRIAWFRSQVYYDLIDEMSRLALISTWPISFMTLVSLVVLIVSNSYWGGYPWTLVAYVMWWIAAAWMIVTLYFVFYHVITYYHKMENKQLSPFLILAAVGVATEATIGGLLSSFAADLSPSEAAPVMIFSFCGVGAALLMALFLYTFNFHQLLTQGFPPPENIGIMFLFVGPMGQCATALQLLGSAAHTYGKFAGDDQGTFLTSVAAAPLDTICVLLALLISGMGIIWLLLAFVAFIDTAIRGKLEWNPSWNTIIFPTGTLVTSFLELAIELNSVFFRIMAGILIVFLVIVYFINLGFTVWKISRGELLIVRKDWREKEQ